MKATPQRRRTAGPGKKKSRRSTPDAIDHGIRQLAEAQRKARDDAKFGTTRPTHQTDTTRADRITKETWDRLNPNDSTYRPRPADSTLRGAGRATGQTAAAIRRGRTITQHEHTQRSRSK